ncbi:Protein SET DOMAIN GROUP 40 [Quillaja saponaria]|uniref:Protein SET DOMAIN GROUP 40 n=1 Tax=Quillaja saponaria TaxID=32244 RepID=A0AAD7PMB6_QUISA|nr:Protein SET DOMAIN GROUP 40 [Quillaja saponaria]
MEEDQQSFLKWAGELGVSDSTSTDQLQDPLSCLGHSLCVSHFPQAGGRGLCAVRDLRKGELILRVPKSALLTSQSVMNDKKLSVAVNKHPSLSSTQILTVCLLYEMGKGKKSKWHPYLIHLPRTYDILATFGEFEKQALQVDDARWVTENAVLKAQLNWKEANALIEDLKLKPQFLTFRAWLWATATISSRTLHIPWDEAGCLCPVGDLFNYAAPGKELVGIEDGESCLPNHPSHVTSSSDRGDMAIVDVKQFDPPFHRLTDGGFEETIDAYCFYARENYRTGEQVLLCYGTYTNLELLEHYGFLLDENPNNKVFIPLGAPVYSSSSWPKQSLYIHHNGKPSYALLSALRLSATPQNKRRSVGHLAYSGSQLSADNENFVMKFLSKKCSDLLKNLPTSIEEDIVLLSAMDSQDLSSLLELRKVLSYADEICNFMEANNLRDGEGDTDLEISRKTKKYMDRWRLAVEWRIKYKQVLVDCILYCTEVINSLSKILQ